MTVDFFEKNLKALDKNKDWFSKLQKRAAPTSLEILNAKNGQATLRYNGVLLHSVYDPETEGNRFSEKISGGSQVVLYGFGMGYHLPELLNRLGDDGSLVVIELNPDILKAALTCIDHSAVLSDPRFSLIYAEDEESAVCEISSAMAHLNSRPGHPLEILFFNPAFKCIPEQFPRLSNALEVLLIERRFPAVLGDQERSNLDWNRDRIVNSSGIKELIGAHSKQTAMLVSAGPSLDSVLPYLKLLGKKALIACVDTALPVLMEEGIAPDYIFTLDPQEASFKHFNGRLEQSATLIFTPTACPRVVASYAGPKRVAIQNGHRLYKNEVDWARDKGVTQSGGSVACLALDCLIQWGCGPILLIGQDCAFTSSRAYARSSVPSMEFLDRVLPGGTVRIEHHKSSVRTKTTPTKGVHGNMVNTSQVMYSYLRSLEEIIDCHPDVPIVNWRSHGAHIGSIPNIQTPRPFTLDRQ